MVIAKIFIMWPSTNVYTPLEHNLKSWFFLRREISSEQINVSVVVVALHALYVAGRWEKDCNDTTVISTNR